MSCTRISLPSMLGCYYLIQVRFNDSDERQDDFLPKVLKKVDLLPTLQQLILTCHMAADITFFVFQIPVRFVSRHRFILFLPLQFGVLNNNFQYNLLAFIHQTYRGRCLTFPPSSNKYKKYQQFEVCNSKYVIHPNASAKLCIITILLEINMIQFLLAILFQVNAQQQYQLSCNYLQQVGTIPLGKVLESFNIAYITFDFSKYNPALFNYTDKNHFILYRQNDNPQLPPTEFISDKFGALQSSYSLKVFNFDSRNSSIIIQFQPDFQQYLKSNKQSCKNIEAIISPISFSFIAKSPSRAVFGSSEQFPIILSEQYLTAYLLPYNLPESNLKIIVDNIGDVQPQVSKPLYQPFWKGGYSLINDGTFRQLTTVAIPWLPFFSQCKGYGQHIYLYELLESRDGCKNVDPIDIKLVQTIPTSGLQAVADSCSLNIDCYYEENVTETEGLKWWQSDGNDPLFFIASGAINSQTFLDNRADEENFHFANMITDQSDDLIPVIFFTDGVLKNSIPTSYHLEIKYNQLSKQAKKIIKASVTASNYKQKELDVNQYQLSVSYTAMNYLELINSFQFDTPIYLVLFTALGFVTILGILMIWLMNKLISRIEHPPKLRVNQTFMVAFIPPIIGSIIAIAPIMLYLYIIVYLISTRLFSTIFFMYDQVDLSDAQFNQFQKGRTGLIILVSGINFIIIGAQLLVVKPSEEELKMIKNNLQKKEEAKELTLTEEDQFEKKENISVNSKDEVKEEIISSTEKGLYQNSTPDVINRIQFQRIDSNKLSAIPIAPTQQYKISLFRKATLKKIEVTSPKSSNQQLQRENSSSPTPEQRFQQIQQPFEQEQNLQHQNSQSSMINQLRKENKKDNGNDDDKDRESVRSLENESEQLDIPDYLNCKNAHFETIALLTAFFTLGLLGFSYLKLFEKNIFYFLILLQFVDAIYSWILSNYLLTESMLIQPMMATLEIIQFVMFMAAESLQDFIISYLIRMCLIISFRTYINPILKNLKYFSKKLARWMISRYPQTEPYLVNYLEASTQDKNIKFYLGIHSKQEMEFKEEQSVEHVITMILSFSSKMHAIFLKPFALVIIKLFERETQIPKLYNIKFRDFDFYIYFAFLIIFPQIIIDIYVLNSLELIYGYKLFDYFHYCKYRYDFRTQKNIEHSLNLDRSVSIEHRSIDNMKFTFQFYFYGTIVIFGILFIIIGTTIIIRNNYQLFGDPVIFVHILFVFGFFFIMIQLIKYIFNKIDPLKEKDSRLKIPLDQLEEVLNSVKENLEQIMEVDIIRKHFIELNKEWIIDNMNLFISSETFAEQEGFLLKIYEDLIKEEEKEEKENKRLEMLAKKQKELELKSRKKSKKQVTNEDEQATEKSPKYQESSLNEQSSSNLPMSIMPAHAQQEILVIITKSQVERLKKLLFIWFYQAKSNLFLKSLLKQVLQKNLEEHCRRCGLDIELRVVEQTSFTKMANSYQFKTLGTPFNKYNWIKYYEKTQKFITLCLDCEIGYRSRMLQKQNRQATSLLMNYAEKNENKKGSEKDKVASGTSLAKSIVLKWLIISRSNILIKKPNSMLFSKKMKTD